MKVLMVREMARLLDGREERDIVSVLELGEEGGQLTVGPQWPGGPRERWIVAPDGSSRLVEGEGL